MRTDLSPVTDMQVCSSFAYVSGPGTGYHGDPAVVSIDMGNKRVFKRYLGHKAPVLLSRVSDHKYLWSGASDAAVHCTLLRSGTVVIQLRAYPLQFLAALLATAASFVQLLSIPFVYDTTAFHDVGASPCCACARIHANCTHFTQALAYFQLSFVTQKDDTGSAVMFHLKNAVVAALTLATIVVVHSRCVKRVTKALATARAAGKPRAAKRALILRRLGWGLVWLLTTVAFMPVIKVLLSPIKCNDNAAGELALAAAPAVPCYSAARYVLAQSFPCQQVWFRHAYFRAACADFCGWHSTCLYFWPSCPWVSASVDWTATSTTCIADLRRSKLRISVLCWPAPVRAPIVWRLLPHHADWLAWNDLVLRRLSSLMWRRPSPVRGLLCSSGSRTRVRATARCLRPTRRQLVNVHVFERHGP